MRFQRQTRHEFEDTRRKRLAALRWQQKQRDRLPLLAAVIAEQQPSVDALMQKRADDWLATTQATRDRKAAQWREGRRRLAALEPEAKAAATHYWNTHKWLPGDPAYLLDMMHGLETGRLIRDSGTLRYAKNTITAAEATDTIPAHKPPVIPGLTPPPRKPKGPSL